MQPEVSVVMSVYNGAQYLGESVQSILSQESVDLEFIIVNDGSTDGSKVILERYASLDSRIRLINTSNQGLTNALIVGCSEAKADFIARQDADDVSVLGRLKKQLAYLQDESETGFVSSYATCIGPSGEELSKVTRPISVAEATCGLLTAGLGPPAHGTLMFRRNLYNQVGGYRSVFYYAQDSDLWLRMVQRAEIAYIPEYLYSYRLSLESISVGRRDIQKKFGQLAQLCHVARLNNKPETELLTDASELREAILAGTIERQCHRKRLSSNHYFLGSCLQDGGNPGGIMHFWKAIQANPLHWRAWIKLLAAMTYKLGSERANVRGD